MIRVTFRSFQKTLARGFLSVILVCTAAGQPHDQSNTDAHDAGRRSEVALSQAETDFDSAREAYNKGDVEKGDQALEEMTKALNALLGSLDVAHKARFYKKAELRVANLQRRMATLLDDIELPARGWAEQTSRTLEGVHDKLLAGAMRK